MFNILILTQTLNGFSFADIFAPVLRTVRAALCVSLFSNCIRELCVPLSLPEIKLLDVSKNSVEKVSADFLTGCPKLETLNVSANKICECGAVGVRLQVKRLNWELWAAPNPRKTLGKRPNILDLFSRFFIASSLQTHHAEAGKQQLLGGFSGHTRPPEVSDRSGAAFRADPADGNSFLD